MNRCLESLASTVQEPLGSQHGVLQSPDVLSSGTPWMLTDECAAYMKFRTVKTFRNWLNTTEGRRLPRGHRGRVLLFDRRVVDAFLADLLSSQRRAKKPVSVKFSLVHRAASVRESHTER